MDFSLIRSRRRSVSLLIGRNGRLTVRAPLGMSLIDINKLISDKRVWIEKHLRTIKPIPKKAFSEGEAYLYLGRGYPLRIINAFRSRLEFKDGAFHLSRFKINLGKDLFTDWYKKQATIVIQDRADHFAGLMGVKFQRLMITSANTRWGSCSSQSTINFSWRLILAPLEIVDSVVVHELAHLIHHNHSKRFWDKVKEYYPDYQKAKKWLKSNSHLLHI